MIWWISISDLFPRSLYPSPTFVLLLTCNFFFLSYFSERCLVAINNLSCRPRTGTTESRRSRSSLPSWPLTRPRGPTSGSCSSPQPSRRCVCVYVCVCVCLCVCVNSKADPYDSKVYNVWNALPNPILNGKGNYKRPGLVAFQDLVRINIRTDNVDHKSSEFYRWFTRREWAWTSCTSCELVCWANWRRRPTSPHSSSSTRWPDFTVQ